MPALQFGLDRLLTDPALRRPLRGRRLALLAHPASVSADLGHALDALAALPDLHLTAAFGPQHGLRGDKQDNMVESPDFLDPQLGIPVFNAPHSSTRSVAELVLGYVFALSRQLTQRNQELHNGVWTKLAKGAYEIRGKKLGIIGYGNIGSSLSVLAEALGMTVLFYDIQEKLALGNAVRCDSLHEVLSRSDIVTLHVDGRKENKDLIGAEEFAVMKDGALFINASRGAVTDVDSLYRALRSGKLHGAAVDVFPKEPKSNKEIFESPLRELDNVILTPHIGASTEEAQKNIGDYVAAKCVSFINTGNTMLSVNFPQLQLPEQRNVHRIIHIHRNRPGVLSKINGIIAHYKINIEGQYLKTNEHIGYVITDVAAEYPKEVIKELKSIPETIRLRMLY